MPFVVLEAKTFFKDSSINEIDARYFHGSAMRGGQFPDSKSARLQFDADVPLKIRKNISGGMPAVFCPEGELVVKEEIAVELKERFDISYSAVEFLVLYDFNYKSDKMERYDFRRKQMDSHSHQPGIQVDPYCRIDCPPVRRVKYEFNSFPTIRVSITTGGFSEREEYPASEDIFGKFPIYKYRGFAMKTSVFEIIRPHLDLRFFVFSDVIEF